MQIPQKPPQLSDLRREIDEAGRFSAVFGAYTEGIAGDKYSHWDKLRHLKPPGDLSHREWWFAIRSYRLNQQKPITLGDIGGKRFSYALADPIPEGLQQIDLGAGGRLQMPDPITNPETKDQYLVGSLIEEAITSSQLEGAATTRLVAKEMIRAGRKPADRSERMILNNFLTMQRIGKLKAEPLSADLVFDIHRQVTQGTLDDPSAAGRFRRADERIDVGDDYGTVFHEPPPAEQLERRVRAMCDFANGKTPGTFVHPMIRSIILHFWLAYDHPFVDGNGRTARALFYWSMLRHGYWLCEFISISEIIRKAPARYGRAFLYTETDDNDLTYFLLYHLHVIRRAIDQLYEYVKRKTEQLQALERELRGIAVLNHRQRALISHALRHPHHRYTIESHRCSSNVVYQTARADLLDLAKRGLLVKEKAGRRWLFTPAHDLNERLRTSS
ncbi:MAG TPA: Fic family protein [Phycisphaerae bacterium]|nr:Fic family protein [Phycisphaerae bacterium]